MKYTTKYVLITLLATFALSSCKKQVVQEREDILEPIDVILNLQMPEYVESKSIGNGVVEINLGNGVANNTQSKADYEDYTQNTGIRNVNIFMFYKGETIPSQGPFSKHYYQEAEQAGTDISLIKIPGLYVGEYEIFIIANNGSSLCPNPISNTDCGMTSDEILNMWSTETFSTVRNVMVYHNTSVYIDRFREGNNESDHSFDIKLALLSSKIDFTVTNNRSIADNPDNYMALRSWSFANVVKSVPLYDQEYVSNPTPENLSNSSAISFSSSSDQTAQTITRYLLPNCKGNGTNENATAHEDRHYGTAPAGASALILNLDHINSTQVSKLSYIIFMGETNPEVGYNNYDMQKAYNYKYDINVGYPNLDDPRLISMTVTNEKEIFKPLNEEDYVKDDKGNPTSSIYSGRVIKRPLTIEYSNVFNNNIQISCENTITTTPKSAIFEIWDETETIKIATSDGTADLKISEALIPFANQTIGETKNTAKLVIKYSQAQSETGKVSGDTVEIRIAITVRTTLGLERTIVPTTHADPYQTIIFTY